jgi:hypothetical protein
LRATISASCIIISKVTLVACRYSDSDYQTPNASLDSSSFW